MNKPISKENFSHLLEQAILECECDNRIETGIFDMYDAGHLVVLAEHMVGLGVAEDVFEEVMENIVLEGGKHPDRQAFNDEGWLVTFPSKEYRDAAIKKGTHSIADPTHGKGGMNLYYKRKGKQKRQKQQTISKAAGAEQPEAGGKQPVAQPPRAGAAAPSAQQPVVKDQPSAPSAKPAAKPTSTGTPQADPTSPETAPSGATGATQPSGGDQGGAAVAGTPAIDVPVVTTPPDQYARISEKFAAQKGWKPEPYGEYRDLEGNPVAVVGLTGEVVPIKSNDREEYKIFAEKELGT